MAPGPTMTAMVFKESPLVGTFHAAGASQAYVWLNPVVRWLRRRLDVCTAVSEDARAMAQQALGGEYLVWFNGIEIDRIERTTPIEADDPTIFFVGRHEPRKGLEVLLHAMALLPANVRLWIAGDGPDTTRLTSTVAGDPRIEWLGRISDEEKFARLRGATVFCAPSLRGESFGVVLLEAMAAHTPIVASNLHGYANVARAGRDAVLVDPDDSAALAAALSSVLGDDDVASRLVASGIERAAGYSMTALADLYLDLYEEAIAKSGA
jgi:phosphatidylinositol alpha-mannosyltransferase